MHVLYWLPIKHTLSLKLKDSTLEKISKHEFLLIPTLFKHHWRVLIIDNAKKEITIFDSLNLFEPDYMDLVRNMLGIILVTDGSLLSKVWRFKCIFKPSQNNSYDCGAFICLFARNFFLNSSSSFSQNLPSSHF
jgi:Ulp1 family protease